MSKGRIFLFHWNKTEAEAYAEELRGQGWDVDLESEDGARGGNAVKLNPPAAVVFYFSRLPSHSRATARVPSRDQIDAQYPAHLRWRRKRGA